MATSIDKRLSALEQSGSGPERTFVYYTEPEPRYVANGQVVDVDTFAEQVRRAGNRATVIRVQYAND